MESRTYLKNLRISPKKIRFLLPEIKKMKPAESLNYLYYGKEKAARILYKAIKSALANAKNTLKVEENLLKFKVLTIEEGQKLKRYRAGSRGSANAFKRRLSHIKIVLEPVVGHPLAKAERKEKKVKKAEIKKEAVKNSKTVKVRKSSAKSKTGRKKEK